MELITLASQHSAGITRRVALAERDSPLARQPYHRLAVWLLPREHGEKAFSLRGKTAVHLGERRLALRHVSLRSLHRDLSAEELFVELLDRRATIRRRTAW